MLTWVAVSLGLTLRQVSVWVSEVGSLKLAIIVLLVIRCVNLAVLF